MSFFSELGLAEPLIRALETKGYGEPTPIQVNAIPALLAGRDLLGIAQTGTGKTAAFSLPSLHRLAEKPLPRQRAGCRMLVLSPTRELAAQIADNIRGYAKYLDINVQCVFGGVPVGKQARALVPGCDILVATPGRLLDLIDQRALTLRHVEIFVLDEADQMMDLGFIVPLKRVSAMLPKERQSLFFSATMPKAIADLGKQFINNPVRVEVTPQATTAERVVQYVTHINQGEKQALLTIKLRDGLADGTIDRALVFTRTKHGADRVTKNLAAAKIEVAAIHGNKSQGQRTAAIQGFRSGALRVLVATDIAARGIDIPGVSHVFNFEMPNVPEQYVHRIGRTARAGADGIAESFVASDEKPYLRDIERLTDQKLMPMPLPEDFAKEAARLPAPPRSTATADRAPGGRGSDGRRAPMPRGKDPRRDSDRGPRPARMDGAPRPARDGETRSEPRIYHAVRTDGRPSHQRDGEARGGAPRPARADGAAPRRDGDNRSGAPAQHRPARSDGAPHAPRAARPEGAPRPPRTDNRPAAPSGNREGGNRGPNGAPRGDRRTAR